MMFRCCFLLSCLLLAGAARAQDEGAPSTVTPSGPTELELKLEGIVQYRQGVWLVVPNAELGLPARLSWLGGSIEAGSLVYFQEDNAVYADGLVRLRLPGFLLRADTVYYDLAEGTGRGEDVYLHATGELVQTFAPQLTPAQPRIGEQPINQVVLRARRASWGPLGEPVAPEPGLPPTLQVMDAEDVTVTPSEMTDPTLEVHAEKLRLTFDEGGPRLLSVRDARLIIYDVTLLDLSSYTYDIQDPHGLLGLELALGESDEWGWTASGAVLWGFRRPRHPVFFAPRSIEADIDYRQFRGWGWGAEVPYVNLSSGRGGVDYYYTQESLISVEQDQERAARNAQRRQSKVIGNPQRQFIPNLLDNARRAADGATGDLALTPLLYQNESRYGLEWEHRSSWREQNGRWADARLDLWGEMNLYSDRDYRQEYDENAFKTEAEPETQAFLRAYGTDLAGELLGRWRANDFFTRTEYLPELRVGLPGRPLPGGFLVGTTLRAGHLRRRFDQLSDSPGFETERAHAFAELSRPLSLGPLGLYPFVALHESWYAESRTEEDVRQSFTLYGAEASLRVFGHFLDPDGTGLRHIIQPRVRFLSVSEPHHDPVDIYDFDEVEELDRLELLQPRLEQRLQSRRINQDTGLLELVDVASLSIYADYFTDDEVAARLNSGNAWDLLTAAISIRPHPSLEFGGRTRWELYGDNAVRELGASAAWTGPAGSGVSVAYNAAQNIPEATGSSVENIRAEAAAPLGRLWLVQAAVTSELQDSPLTERGITDTAIRVTRSFHDWRLTLSVVRDVQEDDVSVGVSIQPRGTFVPVYIPGGEPAFVGHPPLP